MKHSPIAFIQGDETAQMAAEAVRRSVFGDLPTVDVDVSVGARLATGDQCLRAAVAALREHGGMKISTATADPRIKDAGLPSANIVMRRDVDITCMIRLTQAPGRYERPVGVIRLGDGDIYSMTASEIVEGDGPPRISYTTEMRLDILQPAAETAIQVAQQHDLRLKLFVKDTIRGRLPRGAPVPDQLIRQYITDHWHSADYQLGVDGPMGYDYHLTDDGIGHLPLTHSKAGGFLVVLGNALGDIGSDLLDFEHGGFTMSSQVVGMDGTTYEELALGTAPKLLETDLRDGRTMQNHGIQGNFYNPLSIILGFASAFEKNNPHLAERMAKVKAAAIKYLNETPIEAWDTHEMIASVAEAA